MNQKIQTRIDQIRRGEVPEGYKKTKVGIVPEEWKNYLFADLFVPYSEHTQDLERYPLYSLTIEDGVTAKTERYERSHLVKKEDSYKVVRPNDFAYNPMNLRFGAVSRHKGSNHVCVSGYYDIFTTKHKGDLLFMDSYLVSDKMITYYNKVSAGSLVEKQRVHFSQFLEFNLPLPDLKERETIAEILAAQDKVIALKEKLLEEKKKQKKYLIQQLLTGKKRLPGFTGEWESIKFGDIFSERVETNCDSLELLSVTGMQGVIPRSEIETKDNSSDDKSKYLKICKGDIGYNTMRMWQGVSALSEYEGIVSPAYTVLIPNDAICARYFSYLFKTHAIIFLFYRFSQGIVDDTRCLKYPEFAKLYWSVPKDKKEQEAIEAVLANADKELSVIQKSIDQEKQKKKALMQLLLTGIVRT